MAIRLRRMAFVLLTMSLLVVLLIATALPAGAKSINGVVVRQVLVFDDWVSTWGSETIPGTGAINVLTLKEDSDFKNDFKVGDRFRISLKPGVKWVRNFYVVGSPLKDPYMSALAGDVYFKQPFLANSGIPVSPPDYLNWDIKSDAIMEITITGGVDEGLVDTITIPLYVDISGSTGGIFALVENIDSGVTGGSYTFAVARSDKANIKVESVEMISGSGNGGLVRIDETIPGTITGTQKLRLQLPEGFAWDSIGDNSGDGHRITFGGGFGDVPFTVNNVDDRTAEIVINFPPHHYGCGSIYIETPIEAGAGAAYGYVKVSFIIDNILNADAVVAYHWNDSLDRFTVELDREQILTGAGKTVELTLEFDTNQAAIDAITNSANLYLKLFGVKWPEIYEPNETTYVIITPVGNNSSGDGDSNSPSDEDYAAAGGESNSSSSGGRGGGSKASGASLSSKMATYTIGADKDISVTIKHNGRTLDGVSNANYILKKGTDYGLDGDQITIRTAYLDTLKAGDHVLTFNMSSGANPKFSINVKTAAGAVEKGTDAVNPIQPDVITAKSGAYSDINSGDWFYNDVHFITSQGYMLGTGNGVFSPNMTLNRAMVVTVLYRIAGSPAVSKGASFTDVPDGEWYSDAVQWASENGVTNGYGNGSFGSMDNITRQDLAVLINRYADLYSVKGSEPGVYSGFADEGSCSGYAVEAVKWCVQNGIINGKPGNIFDPANDSTRAEFAAVLNRLLN